MDWQRLYDEETPWLERSLSRGRRDAFVDEIVLAAAPGRDEVIISGADVSTLRWCWVVCEALCLQDPALWPRWPRDLEPSVIEVFALAAFAHNTLVESPDPFAGLDDVWRYHLYELHNLVYERLRWRPYVSPHRVRSYDKVDDLPLPLLNIQRVTVPESCAAFFGRQLRYFAYITRTFRRVCDHIGMQTLLRQSRIPADRACLFYIRIRDTALSYAGVMLLTVWMQAMCRRMRANGQRCKEAMYGMNTMALQRVRVAYEHISGFMTLRDEADVNAGALRRNMAMLSGEYWDYLGRRVAVAQGLHARTGAVSHLMWLDDALVQAISASAGPAPGTAVLFDVDVDDVGMPPPVVVPAEADDGDDVSEYHYYDSDEWGSDYGDVDDNR